ncbi:MULTISPECIES: hypothetical protein [unclassified Streptomyces]|uniref:hypothetical protein n=1 Tax=unclassified Streptomyces TaxID=2593676 RepID=UPI0035D87986
MHQGPALGVAVIGNVFFSHADEGLTDALTHAGTWAAAAYIFCAVLCLSLARRAIGNQTEPSR